MLFVDITFFSTVVAKDISYYCLKLIHGLLYKLGFKGTKEILYWEDMI